MEGRNEQAVSDQPRTKRKWQILHENRPPNVQPLALRAKRISRTETYITLQMGADTIDEACRGRLKTVAGTDGQDQNAGTMAEEQRRG